MARRENNIVDRYDRPVAGVTVTVYDENDDLAICTDDSGNPLNTELHPILSDASGLYYYNANDAFYRETYIRGGTNIAADEIVAVGSASSLPTGAVINSLGNSTVNAPSQNAVQGGLDARPTSAALASATGSALIGFTQSGTGASTRTIEQTLQSRPRNAADFTLTLGLLLPLPNAAALRAANGANIQKALDAAYNAGGGQVDLPAGRIEFTGTLTVKFGVYLRAQGEHATGLFRYTSGSNIAIDLKGSGSGSYPADRTICGVSGFTLDGENADAGLIGIRCGYNYRSMGLIDHVRLINIGHYGILIDSDNQNITLTNLLVDQCGRRTAGSCGIKMNASVADINYFAMRDVQVEGSGTASSTAGGWQFEFSSLATNRGWNIENCILQKNFGAAEGSIANMRGVAIAGNLYIERESDIPENLVGLRLNNVTGSISNANVFSAGVVPQHGISIEGGSKISVRDTSFSGWNAAGLRNLGSTVYTRNLIGATYADDSTAQWRGDYAPAFGADKGGSNQSIPDSVFTKVTFATERYDDTGAFDTSNSRYTPKTIGRHTFKGTVTFTAMTDQASVILSVWINGSPVRSFSYRANGTGSQTFPIPAVDINLTSTNDYAELFARQITGSSQSISGSTDETFLSASLVQ